MYAVVLAAGPGIRCRPLTERRPRSMLPVGARPLLEHVLDSLVAAGVTDVVFVVGHRRERIQGHFGDGDDWGVDLSYVVQEKPLGTGDALLRAEEHHRNERTDDGDEILVVNGDRVVEPALVRRLVERRGETGDTCMAVTRVEDPTLYGMVTLDGDRVTDLVEKPPANAVTSNLVNAGVYAVGPEIFAAIRETEYTGDLELTDTFAQHLDERPIRPVRYDGPWIEVTCPWDLLTATSRMLDLGGSLVDAESSSERAARDAQVHDAATVAPPATVGANTTVMPGARVLGSTVIGPNVRIGANAVVDNAVVLPDATIGPGAVLTGCIVGERARVGANVTATEAETTVVVDGQHHGGVRFGALVGDAATVGPGAVLSPGTILGNEVDVEGGCRLDGTFPSGAMVTRG